MPRLFATCSLWHCSMRQCSPFAGAGMQPARARCPVFVAAQNSPRRCSEWNRNTCSRQFFLVSCRASTVKVQREAWPEATNADELHDALMLLGVMTRDEVQRTVHRETNGAAAEQLLNELVTARRSTQWSAGQRRFWVTSERLPMLQIIYPDATLEPEVVAPESVGRESWERSNAIRELLRGRMEVSGPVTVTQLEEI